MKHAYCIIAHNEPLILQKLIEAIDDDRNDIYLLIDKKADISIFQNIKVQKSNLTYVPRIDIRWGDISQIKAELILFETASKQNVYQYYHLLSGVDLPIKSQDYIHDLLTMHHGKQFVGYAQGEYNQWDLKRKTSYYYILTRYYHSPLFIKLLCKAIRTTVITIQKMVGFTRKFNIELKKGINWVSITHEFCTYLLTKKQYILKTFKNTLCPDEIFIQTILWNSPFRSQIYNPNSDFESCLREIDWERGNPYLWGKDEVSVKKDLTILKHSEKLFARKFSSKDMHFINEVLKLSHNKHQLEKATKQ